MMKAVLFWQIVRAFSMLFTTIAPSALVIDDEMMMFSLSFSGLNGRESHVFRPIMMV